MAMADANILRKGWQNDIDYCTVQYTEALRQYKNFTRLNKKEDADKWKQKADYCSKERDRLVEEAKQDGFIYKNGRVKPDATKWPEASQKRTSPTTVKEAASSVSAGTGHSETYNSFYQTYTVDDDSNIEKMTKKKVNNRYIITVPLEDND